MKKIFRLIGKILLSFIGLLFLITIILFITGIPKPRSFRVYNIPKISIASVREVMSMGSTLPDLYSLMDFDDKGQLYFSRAGMRGETLFYLDNFDTVRSTQYILPMAKRASLLTGNNHMLVFLDILDPKEERCLLSFNMESGQRDTIFAGKSSVTDYLISPEGSFVLLANWSSETLENELFKVSLDIDTQPVSICSFNGSVSLQSFDRSRQFAYMIVSVNEKDGLMYKVNLVSGEKEIVFDDESDHSVFQGNIPTWYERQKRFLVLEDDSTCFYARTGEEGLNKEFAALFKINLHSLDTRQVSPQMKGDIGHIAISGDKHYLVYLFRETGFSNLYLYDLASETNRLLYAEKEYPIFSNIEKPFLIHPTKNKVYFSVLSGSGSKLICIDLPTGEETIISEHIIQEEMRSCKFSEFIYPTLDTAIGMMKGIHAFKFEPINSREAKRPVAINFHGGPDYLSNPIAQDFYSLMLLSKGFVVITPNYRGSGGYGLTFEQADNGYKRNEQVKDVKALVEWIKNQPDLDSEKILLLGVSWGGYMVNESLIRYPELFLGGISISGNTDIAATASNPFFLGWAKEEFGDTDNPQMKQFLDSISPYNNASRISKPLYLIHGTDDPRVGVDQAKKLYEALESEDKDVWYLEVQGQGHLIFPRGPLESFYQFSSVNEFVNKLLGEFP